MKRKAECSPCVVLATESTELDCEVVPIPANSDPKALGPGPTGERTAGEIVSGHVNSQSATVAKEGGDTADAFWSLLAAAGYQTW